VQYTKPRRPFRIPPGSYLTGWKVTTPLPPNPPVGTKFSLQFGDDQSFYQCPDGTSEDSLSIFVKTPGLNETACNEFLTVTVTGSVVARQGVFQYE
jgi:hypothetical protein